MSPPPGLPCRTLLLGFCLALLAACHARNPAGAAGPQAGDARDRVLNIDAWIDYIPADVIAGFERENGVHVRYDTYDNNEALETRLLAGHTGYDVVMPGEHFFDRQLQAGVYRELDPARLPNRVHVDPEILRRMAVHDPGNRHAVPYLWSSIGLVYDTDKIRARLGAAPAESWNLLFDPARAARLADCGIAVIDSPLDVMSAALLAVGRDPSRRDPADIAAAAAALTRIRPQVRLVLPTLIDRLADGDLCLALIWSGDAEVARRRALARGSGARLAYFVPREGSVMTLDMVAIPADAPHPDTALAFLDYIMRPQVMAAVSSQIGYPNAIPESLRYVDPALRGDSALFPDAIELARLRPSTAVPLDYTRAITREWTRFRTGH